MIKRMKSDCIKVMANMGLASGKELEKYSETILFSGEECIFK